MLRCDRCDRVVRSVAGERDDHYRFDFEVWNDAGGRDDVQPPGDLCEGCALSVGERLTAFARDLGLPHRGQFGTDLHGYARRPRPTESRYPTAGDDVRTWNDACARSAGEEKVKRDPDPIYGDRGALDYQGLKEEVRHLRAMRQSAHECAEFFQRKYDETKAELESLRRGSETTPGSDGVNGGRSCP